MNKTIFPDATGLEVAEIPAAAAKVSVLAVLDWAAEQVRGGHVGASYAERQRVDTGIRETRAAIAELIEALLDFDGMDEPSMPGMPPRLRRLRAALARVRGES